MNHNLPRRVSTVCSASFPTARPDPMLAAIRSLAIFSLILMTTGAAWADQTPADTILEAVPATPTALASDAGGNGYENKEYNNATTATLVRNPYVQKAPNALGQDVTKFEPYLAESYEVSPDGLVYTFHLRKGVLSQAGNELTADDVLWSIERKWKGGTTVPFTYGAIISDYTKQVQKVDKYTVTITMARLSDGFSLLGFLSNPTGGIHDSVFLKSKATPDDPYAVKWSGKNGGWGFGPFMLKSFTAGQELVLVANPNAVFKPKVARIIQRVVPDVGTRVNLLRNGDVDIAAQLRPSDIEDLAKDDKIDTFRVTTNNFIWFVMRTNGKPFNDLAVRQAFQYAIPYQKIVDEVYKGRATVMRSLLNPVYQLASDGLPDRVYNPDLSREILKKAGYDGPVPVTVTISNAVPDMRDVLLQIQTAAAPAGFDVSINVVPAAGFSQALDRGTYEALVVRDMAVTQSPPLELRLLLAKGSPLNWSKWENDDYYAEITAGIAAGDPLAAPAAAHWNAAQKMWRENVPYITVASVEPLAAFSKRVKGFAHRTDNVLDFSLMSKQ
jgi:peptide/nickel transport system substrate-binding protein